MDDDGVADLPAPVADGEIVFAEQPKGLLVGGNPKAVESYLTRLRESAGNQRDIEVLGEGAAQ